MNRFAMAAKDLQIKKLADDIRIGSPPESMDDVENNDDDTDEAINEENEAQIENEYTGIPISDIADEIIKLGDELGSGKKFYKCEECEASYKTKWGLYLHTSSKHEGICYSCKYCGYKATTQGNLKRHQELIHEGVKYPCNLCDYQATHTSLLKDHIKVVHDGIKYSCDKCNYQATQQTHLKTHKKFVHDM